MNILFRIIGFLLAVLTPLLSTITWDPLASFDKEVPVAEEKIGGFMKGVCHLDPDYDLIKEGNIEWYRDDIPFPYNADGTLSQSYINWKAYAQGYVDNGIRIFGVMIILPTVLTPVTQQAVKEFRTLLAFILKTSRA